MRPGKGPDPVYGEELSLTWGWLTRRVAERGGTLDFGVEALDALLRDSAEPPPEVTVRHAPVLLPAHLDAWAQTSPPPRPSPDVAPFLHGAEALDAADVEVVWRADLEV